MAGPRGLIDSPAVPYMYTFLSFRLKSFRLKDSVDCLHETLSNPIWCLHVPVLSVLGYANSLQ